MLIVQMHGFLDEEALLMEDFLLRLLQDRCVDEFKVETVGSRSVGPGGFQASYLHVIGEATTVSKDLVEIEESISFAGYDVLVGYADRYLPARVQAQETPVEEVPASELPTLADIGHEEDNDPLMLPSFLLAGTSHEAAGFHT